MTKLDELEKSAEKLDLEDRSIEDEGLMKVYLETEPPRGRPGHMKELLKKSNATTESQVNREAKVAKYLFSGKET